MYFTGKYAVFPSGELLVRSVDETDANNQYRCQVHNKLSRETRLSDQWARIIMTGRGDFTLILKLDHINLSYQQLYSVSLLTL